MADLVDSILAQHGLIPEIEKAEPVPLPAVGERDRVEVISHLDLAKASIEMMIAHLRLAPDRDDLFDCSDRFLAQNLRDAGIAWLRFRDRRECEGEA